LESEGFPPPPLSNGPSRSGFFHLFSFPSSIPYLNGLSSRTTVHGDKVPLHTRRFSFCLRGTFSPPPLPVVGGLDGFQAKSLFRLSGSLPGPRPLPIPAGFSFQIFKRVTFSGNAGLSRCLFATDPVGACRWPLPPDPFCRPPLFCLHTFLVFPAVPPLAFLCRPRTIPCEMAFSHKKEFYVPSLLSVHIGFFFHQLVPPPLFRRSRDPNRVNPPFACTFPTPMF